MQTLSRVPVILLLVLGVFFALVAGLASSILPWWLVLPVFALPVVVAASWRWPLVALLGVLMAVFGVLPLSPGSRIKDFLVGMLLVFLLVVRWEMVASVWKLYRKQLLWLGALSGWAVLSGIYGIYYQHNLQIYVYQETATMLYWLLLIVSALIAKDERAAELLLKILIGVSVALSLVSLAQSLFGLRLLFTGDSRVELLDAGSGGIPGVARSLVPALQLVLFSYLFSLSAILRGGGKRWVWWFVLFSTMGALFVTYGRATWTITILLSFLVAALISRKAFGRFVLMSTVLLVVLGVLAHAFMPTLIEGAVSRMTSLGNEGGTSSSFGWRITENIFAIPQILNHPLLGLGFGAEYKPRLVETKFFTEQTRYIHNGYLYILLKTGFVGFLLYMGNYFYIVYSCFKGGKYRSKEYTSRVALGALLIGTLFLNVTQPDLFSASTIASIAVLAPAVLQTRLKWQE
ncbi:MAG: O-antigen ligase family protein [Burkholderiales bacterium]|nr:O-antigen ligase family protein [Burkholderiales bacterium]